MRRSLAVLCGVGGLAVVVAATAELTPSAPVTRSVTRVSGVAKVDRAVKPGSPELTNTAPKGQPAEKRVAGDADLRLTVSAPSRVRGGETYSYTVRVANRGPATPDVVVVQNRLPAGVVRTGVALPKGVGGEAAPDGFGQLVLQRLAPGKSVSMRLIVQVRPGTRGSLVNRTEITFADGTRDPRPRDNVRVLTTHVR